MLLDSFQTRVGAILTTKTAVTTDIVMKTVDERYRRSHGLVELSPVGNTDPGERFRRARIDGLLQTDIVTLAGFLVFSDSLLGGCPERVLIYRYRK